MNYERMKVVLDYMLRGFPGNANSVLRQFAVEELDYFCGTLDKLAVIVDAEAIRRAEKRP